MMAIQFDFVNTYLHGRKVERWDHSNSKSSERQIRTTMVKTLEIRLGKLNIPPMSLNFHVKSL